MPRLRFVKLEDFDEFLSERPDSYSSVHRSIQDICERLLPVKRRLKPNIPDGSSFNLVACYRGSTFFIENELVSIDNDHVLFSDTSTQYVEYSENTGNFNSMVFINKGKYEEVKLPLNEEVVILVSVILLKRFNGYDIHKRSETNDDNT